MECSLSPERFLFGERRPQAERIALGEGADTSLN